MSYIAHQRIKVGGKHYVTGDPIDLTEEELADLPTGAVSEGSDGSTSPADPGASKSPAEPDAPKPTLAEALAELKEDAFRQDGGLRAPARRDLVERLGEDPGDDAITDALAEMRKGDNG